MVQLPDKGRHLEISHKGRYPFRIGTTSFIHPAGYADNVSRIGPHVDEIELLFFESLRGDTSALQKEVDLLGRLAAKTGTTFNVHLPSDVSPGHRDTAARQRAVQALNRVIDLTAPLKPSTLTLHLPLEGDAAEADNVKTWQKLTRQSVIALIELGAAPQALSVETLDYPFEIVEPIIVDLDLSVCVDVGHCIVHGFDYRALFDRLFERIVIMHLHGVANGRDHLSLDRLPQKHAGPILKMLQRFSGTVSLEVFALDKLISSLEYLEGLWHGRDDGVPQ